MDERAHDRAGPKPCFAKGAAGGVGGGEQAFARPFADHAGVMELVAAEPGILGAQRSPAAQQPDVPVAEVKLAEGERGLERQQSRHLVTPAVGILDPGAQHHVAAAFAVDRRAPRRRPAKPGHEAPVRREPRGVKLGIAAREIDRIGILTRSFVGEGRERADLGASSAPAVDHGRIGEGEGDISGDGDPLAERRQQWDGRVFRERRDPGRAGEVVEGLDIDMAGDGLGGVIEKGVEPGVLPRLDEAEVARRQGEGLVMGQGAQHPDARRRRFARLGKQLSVALARHPVEHHAGDGDALAKAGESLQHGGGGGALALDVDNQDHRPAGPGGQIRGRTVRCPLAIGPGRRPGRAVEESHHPFADDQRAVSRQLDGEARQRRGTHRPAVEVDAFPAAGGTMEGGVDIIGTDLEAGRGDPPAG